MNKNKIIQWVSLIFFACFASFGNAQSTGDLCVPQGVVAGFYNGVWNTTADAGVGKNALQSAIGTKTAAGEEIRWEVFYNTTTAKWADMVETFNQRASGQNAVVGEPTDPVRHPRRLDPKEKHDHPIPLVTAVRPNSAHRLAG